MERISIDTHNRIVFYSNHVGYVCKDNAVVDPLFKNDELENWLTNKQKLSVSWTDGVYDRLLINGLIANHNAPLLKACRIWQLNPNVDIAMKFIGYDELVKGFGEPDLFNYTAIYDGELGTNVLEEIYSKFNIDHPVGFSGHSLSMSDIVELYDHQGSEFHYVDRLGFKKITFNTPQHEQSISL